MCFFGVTICLPRKAENTWVVLTVVPFPEEPLMVQEAFLQGQMPTADPQSVCVVVVVGGEHLPAVACVRPTSSPTTGTGRVSGGRSGLGQLSGCGHAESQAGEEETGMTAQPWSSSPEGGKSQCGVSKREQVSKEESRSQLADSQRDL